MSALGRGIRMVAVFEAAKGILVLLAGFGLMGLVHRDCGRMADLLVNHLHLNPARHMPRIFLDITAAMDDRMLWLMAGGAMVYACIRFIEAWGLWHELGWAEWLGAISGGIYIPFELYEMAQGVTGLKVAVLLINGLVVACLARALIARRRAIRRRKPRSRVE